MRRSKAWVVFNVAGMSAYLALASRLWVLPGEEGTPGGPGDAFYFAFMLLPILGMFLVINLVALIKIAQGAADPRRKIRARLWLFVAGLWIATLVLDHQKSVRYIDAEYATRLVVRNQC